MKKLSVLAATLFAASIAMAADEQPAGAPPPGAPGGGGFRGRAGGPGGMMMLNEEQRQVFQDALQKENDKLRTLEDKLRASQKELVEATLASSYDESAVRTKAEAVAKIQTEITLLRAKALAAVAPSLKPEQKQQMTDSPMGAMMLGGGGFGGRAFGGPGGPGGGGFRGRAGGGPGRPGNPDQKPKDQ